VKLQIHHRCRNTADRAAHWYVVSNIIVVCFICITQETFNSASYLKVFYHNKVLMRSCIY